MGWRFFRPRQEAFYLIAPGASQAVTARAAYPDGLYAELRTNKGLIVLRLEIERVPMTVANFVGLAEGTVDNKALPPGVPFFDGTVFHRVVAGPRHPGRHAAGGQHVDRATRFPNEIVPASSHGRAGMLGMANAGPHTETNQFYITLGDRSYLDGNYTVFGEVVSRPGVRPVHRPGGLDRPRPHRARRARGRARSRATRRRCARRSTRRKRRSRRPTRRRRATKRR